MEASTAMTKRLKKKPVLLTRERPDPGLKTFTANQMNMCTARYYESYLEELFMEYWPAKINQIPVLLAKYRGRERFLVVNLQRKAAAIRMKETGRKIRVGAKAHSAIDTLYANAVTKHGNSRQLNDWDQTTLIGLATNKPQKIVEAMRMSGANVNERLTWKDGVKFDGSIAGVDNWGWTDQVFFSNAGGADLGLGLVRRFRLVEGDTLLMAAIKTNKPDLIRAVLKFSPDLSLRNSWHQTAMDVAKQNQIEHILMEKGTGRCQHGNSPWLEQEYDGRTCKWQSDQAREARKAVKMGGWV